MSIGLLRTSAILASALMFAIAAAIELPWSLLVWVALIPWLAALDRERNTLTASANAAVMSAAFTVAVFAWFAASVARYTDVSQTLAFLLLILAAPALQPGFIAFAAVRHLLRTRGKGQVVTAVAAACAWVGIEWLCPRLFGDSLGHGLYPFEWLRQGADIAGAPGLTFVVLLVNQALYTALRERRHSMLRALQGVAAAVVLLATLSGYGALRLQQISGAVSPHAPLRAILVQANLANYDALRARVGSFAAVRTILDTHIAMSRHVLEEGESPQAIDLLIWPETVYPTTFGKPKSVDGAAFDEEIINFATSIGTPLIFGTYDREGDDEFNAAVLVHNETDGVSPPSVYRKKRLFPFTEHVPAWLDSALVRSRLPWLGTWQPGDGGQVLALRRRDGDELPIAPLICLDAVDPRLAIEAARQGAALIVVLSNDGWFADSRGARLHLVVSAFRSIETRLPQLRATNTGISAVITPTGEIVASSPVGQPAVLTGNVSPADHGPTAMTRWGNWFGPAALWAGLLLTLLSLRRPRVVE